MLYTCRNISSEQITRGELIDQMVGINKVLINYHTITLQEDWQILTPTTICTTTHFPTIVPIGVYQPKIIFVNLMDQKKCGF